MAKINVFRTHIEIWDYTIKDYPSLEHKFQVWDPLMHYPYAKGMMYDKVKRILYLPRGINIAYLENFSFDIQYSRYSPGQQIYEYVMTRLIEKNFKKVFLAGGDYDYKRKYGSIEENLYDGVICRNAYYRLKYNLITYYYKHIYWKIIKIKNIG